MIIFLQFKKLWTRFSATCRDASTGKLARYSMTEKRAAALTEKVI
ncbi:hypothetical protein OU5_1837 [Pseudomonas mandelii JR-1]|uniref:Uncharacterized protein n=1 Tax=Pseudomonas mandelii JR-1 TaxID=1147786 RepID=A0A024E8G3_9PSED|nr:hypothetical protein OU5_1837 [Pseudomonas mandelii JR-1]